MDLPHCREWRAAQCRRDLLAKLRTAEPIVAVDGLADGIRKPGLQVISEKLAIRLLAHVRRCAKLQAIQMRMQRIFSGNGAAAATSAAQELGAVGADLAAGLSQKVVEKDLNMK